MQAVLAVVARFVVDDDGQDLVEYGLLAALIAVVAVAGINTLGQTIYTVFWEVIGHGF